MEKIIFSHVSFRTEGIQKLDDFSLTVAQGELLTLLGPAGSGKTAALRLLAGLDTPDAGEIWLDGRKVSDPSDGTFLDPFLRGVGMAFSAGALWPHMTVWQNITFGLQAKGLSRREIHQRVDKLLESLDVAALTDHLPRDLTVIEQRRVALARALVGESQTILIDALTAGTDRAQRVAIRGDMKRLHRDMGLTVLFTTRDDEEALTVSTRVAMLTDGRVAHSGDPMELYLNPGTVEVARRIGTPPINLVPAKGQVEDGLMTVESVLGIHQFTAEHFTEHTRPERLFDCYLGIRPELLELIPGGEGGIGAAVYSCQPAGSETLVQLRVGTQLLLAKCLGPRFYRADQQVAFRVEPAGINVFQGATGALIKRAESPG